MVSFSMGRPRDAPPSARPFPESGKWVKLLLCPACQNKGLQFFYAPHDPVYTTRCLKCHHPYRVTPKGMRATDVQEKLGQSHHNPLVQRKTHHDGRPYVDASKLLEDRLAYYDDRRRYYRQGAEPTLDLQ